MISVYIALSLLPIAVIIFLNLNKNKRKSEPADVAPAKGTTYERERNIALNINPVLLKLTIPDEELLVYGVVMDLDMGEGFMTLACYITGAANLHFSSGSGIRGGGKNPRVGEAAVEFVTDAMDYLPHTKPIKVPVPPSKGTVQFYFLTNKGKFVAQEEVQYIEDNSSIWLSFFEKGSGVITEMHKGAN